MTLATLTWPILERIPLGGSLAVSPHGIGIAVGFLVGAWLMLQRAQKRGLGRTYVPDIPEVVQQLLGRAAIGAMVGARLFFVLNNLDQFSSDPISALYLWEGGLTFLGGVVGAIAYALPWARKQGFDPLMVMDSAMPGIAAGLVLGRMGDLMIGDHIGAPTNFVLGWRCAGDFWTGGNAGGPNGLGWVEPAPYPFGADSLPTIGCYDTAVHQTALYDFGAALFVLLLILWLERRARFDGFFIAAWVYGYGVVRFIGDFARQDARRLGLTGSQWAMVLAATAVTVWLVTRKPWQRRPWSWDGRFEHAWLRPEESEHDGEAQSDGEGDGQGGGAIASGSVGTPDA